MHLTILVLEFNHECETKEDKELRNTCGGSLVVVQKLAFVELSDQPQI